MDIRAELKNMMEEKGLTIVFVATAIGVTSHLGNRFKCLSLVCKTNG